jgi:hypothetical protein
MPFLIIGLLCLVLGVYFFRVSHHAHDEEGLVGAIALIIVGVILTFVYGIFYQLLAFR